MTFGNWKSLRIGGYDLKRLVRVSDGLILYEQKPSIPTASDYVQSSLVAMWDGIENAGWGVHNASATVWKDLIGSYDATLYGCTFSDDGLVASTKGQYAKSSTVPTDKVKHLEVVFQWTGGEQCVVKADGFQLWRKSKGVYHIYNYFGANTKRNGASIDESKVSQISSRTLAGQELTWANGVLQTLTDADYWSGRMMSFFGRADQASKNFSTGVIKSVRIYNRILTEEEILQNWEIDKKRFNLS